MTSHLRTWLLAGLAILFAAAAHAQDKKSTRDIYDFEAQKKSDAAKKIVFIADTAPHGGRGNHEFVAAAVFLAKAINDYDPKAYAVVTTMQKMPKDLKHADAVVVLMNHARAAAESPAVKEAMDKGAGFMAIHYGVEVSKGKQGDNFLKWMGGYFETEWSVNPWWTPEFKEIPKHETTRGVKPFSTRDEWYYHMKFVDGMKGVTPILYDLPPLSTVGGGGKTTSSHGGNPFAYKDVQDGKAQVMAWAYERPEKGGRGFGYTGLHDHKNLGIPSVRTLLTNAVAWVANMPIPENGIPTPELSRDDLETLIDEGRTAVKTRGI